MGLISFRTPALFLLVFLISIPVAAQSGGTVSGTVTFKANGGPVHDATVLLLPLSRSVRTDYDGKFSFSSVPPGKYTLMAHMHPLSDARQAVEVAAGKTATADFALELSALHEEITVTASGREESTLDSFQRVDTVQSLDLAARATAALGEAIENEPGVAKRSFGPGTSRPVVRGFDGDRVLILQDGMPTGTLSAQSGDHGEPVDAGSLESVEVVRGPATLLYGTNAIGGVVNAITQHHQIHEHAHPGVRGFINGSAGSNNALGGGNGGFELGVGKWLFNASGGGLRTGDYSSPEGVVENTHTKILHTSAGLGRYGERGFFFLGYGVQDGRYGIPAVELGHEDHDHEAEEPGGEDHHHHEEEGPVDETWRRQNARFAFGLKNLSGALAEFTAHLNYSDWRHNEIVEEQAHTRFFNKQFSYRGVFEQKRRGPLAGSFGFSGVQRAYKVLGEEALTPPVDQTSFGVFGLEELDIERVRFQFGGRVETNRYSPDGLRQRNFTGVSGAVAGNVRLWQGGAFVASYSNSYRAPALEELYNVGPHPGNLAFEVGDPDLKRERSQGVDLSLRHSNTRVRGELNFFHYRISDYVFMERTGEVRDGFLVANYRQGDARYQGAEARVDVGLRQDLWLNLGLDTVDAELRSSNLPLPRIPPVRGRVGIDARYKGLSVRPELMLSGAQENLYVDETRTAGYATMNLLATYTLVRAHVLHSFTVTAFNLNDRLYRNHVSLIKDFAPEIGRGVRFGYSIRFY